jgi:putative SOS response-associated peptidase YedK
MCGRIAVENEHTFILDRFNADSYPYLNWDTEKKKSDISPGREILVVTKPVHGTGNKKNHLTKMLWGWWFFKRGAKGNKVKQLIFNSRTDTIFENLDNPKKVYADGLAKKRVIIPATAFFEWPEKVKMRLQKKDEPLMGLAGFEVLCKREDGLFVETVTIITTPPTKQMAKWHDRMPLILSREDEQEWLDCKESGREYLEHVFSRNTAELEAV